MEEYIPPVDAAAPGGRDAPRDLTNPNQSVFVATSGEMLPYTPSIAGSRLSEDDFESQDPRRETFSNAEAVANPESVTSVKPTNNSAILDMTNPAYSVPGADPRQA